MHRTPMDGWHQDATLTARTHAQGGKSISAQEWPLHARMSIEQRARTLACRPTMERAPAAPHARARQRRLRGVQRAAAGGLKCTRARAWRAHAGMQLAQGWWCMHARAGRSRLRGAAPCGCDPGMVHFAAACTPYDADDRSRAARTACLVRQLVRRRRRTCYCAPTACASKCLPTMTETH